MQYDVIYDVARDGYSGWVGILCGLGVIVGAAVFCTARKWLQPASLRFIPCVIAPLSLCWLLLWALLTVPGYISLRSALQSGQCAVVEGVVTDFQPMPSSGHGDESFSVAGVRFAYSDFVITPGFHRTTYRGGPMREGLHVRILYQDQDIARLEIAHEQSTATSNHAMQPTTGRRTLKFSMIPTSHPAATRALASGGSSCSR
ncbi:MAG TPA: DUF3592 domain-containing protein [Chthoniobacterales bacterium]|jgi:hypothetical protein